MNAVCLEVAHGSVSESRARPLAWRREGERSHPRTRACVTSAIACWRSRLGGGLRHLLPALGASRGCLSEVTSPGSRPRWREPWGVRRPWFSARLARGILQCGTWSGTIFDPRGERGKTVTDEILLIVLAGAWLFVHVIAHGLTQWVAAGNTWAFGARDDPPTRNLVERTPAARVRELPRNAAAVLVVLMPLSCPTAPTNLLHTAGGYGFGSRVVYLPAYASGSAGFVASSGASRR